jgi:hypothetical protein
MLTKVESEVNRLEMRYKQEKGTQRKLKQDLNFML